MKHKHIDLIYQLTDSHPQGRGLLESVFLNMSAINAQYAQCDMLQMFVRVKFDMDKLTTVGYSLKEILEIAGDHEEVHKFVYQRLHRHIKAEQEANKTNSTE